MFERVRPVGLDLTTKRIDDDSRGPENKKVSAMADNEGKALALWPDFPAGGIWCRLTDLNRHPFPYKGTALPLGLSRLIWRDDVESNHDKQVNSLP